MESIRLQIIDIIWANWNMVVSEIVFFYGFCCISAYDSYGSYTFVADIDKDCKHIYDIWMQ